MKEDELSRLIPNLIQIWELEELTSINSLSREQLSILRGGLTSFLSTPGAKLQQIVAIPSSDKKSSPKGGRPLMNWDEQELKGTYRTQYLGRTLLAALKLACYSPRELVLKQEKAWRKKKYTGEQVKDAVRDADNCVARAERLVQRVFDQHPEYLDHYTEMQKAVREYLIKHKLLGLAVSRLV